MADRKHRVGIAGMVHGHVWGLARSFRACPGVELAAAADPNEPLRERAQKEFSVRALYEDWREMFDKEELDCAVVATENSACADVVEAAAPRGIHVIVEKPMAATLQQADRMLKAAQSAGVQLLINWPTAWSPAVNKAVELVRGGAIGQVFFVRVRMAHQGPKEIGCSPYFYDWLYDAEKNGAGAFMDYCCYGAAFCRHLLGMPSAVTAAVGRLVKDYIQVDDNGMLLMTYDKAFATAEGSWTQIPAYHDMLILGSEGTLITDRGKLLMATKPREEPAEVDLPSPEPGQRNAAEYLLACLEAGTDVEGMCSAQVGRDAQEILEAGLISARTGQRVDLPLGA